MLSERAAVFGVFALNGAALGSWAPRMPAIATQVAAAPGALGLALLGASVGMLTAASLSGRLVETLGARPVIVGSALAGCALLPVVGLVHSVAALGVVLLGVGAAVGVLDVSMNVAGLSAQRRVARPLMPVFHAGFSFGALFASAAAGLAASHDWSPLRHLTVAGVVAAVLILVLITKLPRAEPADQGQSIDQAGSGEWSRRVAPARRLVLWMLATIALCSAIAEGASSDWSALLLVTVHGVDEGAAALAYSGFSLAMALARLAGAWLQKKFGAIRTLAAGAVSAGLGLTAAAVVSLPLAGFLGLVLAGAGLAAAFPTALTLAGDAGKRADDTGGEREVAFVTAIAYTGFLAGPPLIGGIAQLTSLWMSFIVVGVVAAMIAPVAVAVRRLGVSTSASSVSSVRSGQ